MKRLDEPRLLIVGLVVSSTALGSFFSTTTPLLLAMRADAAETRYAKPTDSRVHAVARVPLLPHATCRHSIATLDFLSIVKVTKSTLYVGQQLGKIHDVAHQSPRKLRNSNSKAKARCYRDI